MSYAGIMSRFLEHKEKTGETQGADAAKKVSPIKPRHDFLDACAELTGLNPTSLLPGAISAAGPVQMKENNSFSFMIEHYCLVQRL